MGLFGIKKANEDTKPSNTFINENVINAADYSNMPVNTVVGYNQPTDVSNPDVMNYDANSNNGETFVYSQVSNNDYNNQFVSAGLNQNVDQSTMYNNQMMNQVDSNMYSSEPTSDVVVTVDNNFNQVDSSNYGVNQEFSGMNNVPFDNSALFALPEGAVVEEPEPEPEPVVEEVVVEEEPQVVLDPLNNANNPIPVNPVATNEEVKVVEEVVEEEIPLFDEEEEVKTNLFTVVNMMIGVVIKPGTTISTNARRYKKMFDAISITFWVSVLSFVMCLAGRLVVGCFSKTENAISGASKIVLDFSRLVDTNNYIPYLLITFFIGLGTILVVALIYYLSSFIFSKGIHIGTYFAISTLSVVPVIIGFTILYPIITILSSGIAMMALIFSIIYALIILFTGINEVLKFKNNDQRIIYNAINMAVIFSIMLFIFNVLSDLNILDISMLM
ncbi:MAG: YIP1 family protein [Firmicutes bacterium]|nr:YIP1 family protein [Bacillota bacterium]